MKGNLFAAAAAAALEIVVAEVDFPFGSVNLVEPLVLDFLKLIAVVSWKVGSADLADFEALSWEEQHLVETGRTPVAELVVELVVVIAVMDVEAVDAYTFASFVNYAENEVFGELDQYEEKVADAEVVAVVAVEEGAGIAGVLQSLLVNSHDSSPFRC